MLVRKNLSGFETIRNFFSRFASSTMIKKAAIALFAAVLLTSCSQKQGEHDTEEQEKEGTALFSPFKLF
jgi:hypothetical protein